VSSICARKGAVAQWLSLMGDGTGHEVLQIKEQGM
jgi:hypothetical protein